MSTQLLETPKDTAALWPISGIADRLGIPAHYLESYGKFTAKLRLELFDHCAGRPRGNSSW